MHALTEELVILLLPDQLGQGRTAVLYKALYGTRKASRLWQRFLHDVLSDADWKASVVFASMCTLGDQIGTLRCWDGDLLVEADEGGPRCGGGAPGEVTCWHGSVESSQARLGS